MGKKKWISLYKIDLNYACIDICETRGLCSSSPCMYERPFQYSLKDLMDFDTWSVIRLVLIVGVPLALRNN